MSNRSKEAYKDENAQLKKRIKELEKAPCLSQAETQARELMITRAEELFNIPIRKKSGAVVAELVSQRNLKLRWPAVCLAIVVKPTTSQRLTLRVRYIGNVSCWMLSVMSYRRSGIGTIQTGLCSPCFLEPGSCLEAGQLYALLRQLRSASAPRKTRHTTNSNHRYHKWKT